MNSDRDGSYKETFDYIEDIKKQIDFAFGEPNLNDFQPGDNIKPFCDILIDKVHKEIDWAKCFEDKNLTSIPDRSLNSIKGIGKSHSNKILHNDNHVENNTNGQTFPEPKNINSQDKPLNWTNHYNFETNINNRNSLQLKNADPRYSLYDNSTKFSIYSAYYTLVDQIVNLNNNNEYCKLQIDNDGRILPKYIEDALHYLERYGLNSVGIFRKSGVKSRTIVMRDKMKEKDFKFESSCVYDVADLVKTWFRDLTPHLLTTDLINQFDKKDKEFTLVHLNDCHRHLLMVILKFLSLVSSHSLQNQMTTHNLAICLTPSLCECETEKQINRAQKCLQYCIENWESLFIVFGKHEPPEKLMDHSSVDVIQASPIDILNRILHERNVIDNLISRWSISNQTDTSDVFEFDLQLCYILLPKTFLVKREWKQRDDKGFELEEKGHLMKSIWEIVPNGKGHTLVNHKISFDIGGFSQNWYKTTFEGIHNKQLNRLKSSFEIQIENAKVSHV